MESSATYCQGFERQHYPAAVPTTAPYSSEGSPFAPNLQPDLGDSPVPVWPKQDCDASQIYLDPQSQGPDLGQDRRMLKPTRARRPPRKHTTKEEANFQCEVKGCGKFFSRSYNYKSHLETHDEKREYPFPCPVDGCTKKFVRKTDLQRHHQSVHMKERNHKCDFCGRLFARKDTLRRQVYVLPGSEDVFILIQVDYTDIWKMAAPRDSTLVHSISKGKGLGPWAW